MFQLLADVMLYFYVPFIIGSSCFFSHNFHHTGCEIFRWYFDITIQKTKNGNAPLERKCVYMTNHRSESDFYVDQLLTSGRSVYIARWLVAVAGFGFIPTVLSGRSLFCFARGKTDRNSLYSKLDAYWRTSPHPCLLIYPEGTRNQNAVSKPLKSGFFYYAYERKLPVQIFISTNKENIFSFQKKCSHHGMTMRVAYAKPIYPEDFANVDEFIAHAKDIWAQTWTDAYDDTIETEPFIAQPHSIAYSLWNRFLYHSSCLIILLAYWWACWNFPPLLLYPLAGLIQS